MKLPLNKFLLLLITILFISSISFGQSSRARPNRAVESNLEKPLNILIQPEPTLTDEQRKQISNTKDAVKVKIEFLREGFIGAVYSDDSLPEEINAAIIEAAGKIKFEPEMKNGKPITVYKIIEYSLVKKEVLKDKVKVAPENLKKAQSVIDRIVKNLGGEKYLQIKTQIGRGKFSLLRNGRNVSFQSFTDVIAYPNRERTDFKDGGLKTIQTNSGDLGWFFDEAVESLENQTEAQVKNFKRSMRINIDNLLRGAWQDEAVLSYVGRREASLGKRNDVVKLTFEDGFEVEFEFSDDGFPVKSIYKVLTGEGKEITEEDRFAQFINVQGIKTPYVIDHFSNEVHTSRINYQSVDYNKPISNSIFEKPASLKEAEKDLKL